MKRFWVIFAVFLLVGCGNTDTEELENENAGWIVDSDGEGDYGEAGDGAAGDGEAGDGGEEGCLEGEQDNNEDGVCAPACSALDCGANASCDDSSGEALCSCDAGYQDDDEDGVCRQDCETAVAGGPGFEGRCDGCGTDQSSWATARSNATNACNESGCTEGCTTSIAAWDNCSFDGDANGYVCTSFCGAPPLECRENSTCDDSDGVASCECDAGFQDNNGDGSCSVDCATATAGGDAFEGRCDGCGTAQSSWSSARSSATNACNASGCTEGCTSSVAAWDNCYFDGDTNGYVCISYCGESPELFCSLSQSCEDQSGVAICQ